MNIQEFVNGITEGRFDSVLTELYGGGRELLRQRARYISAVENFSRQYPDHSEIRVFSAPGRTEIGGNHTDHQHGCVLAAAVGDDIIAIAAETDEDVIRIKSEGYGEDVIELCSLERRAGEEGTSAALIRGIAAQFAAAGAELSGLCAYTVSDVRAGCGLSSSAAFENLVSVMLDTVFNGGEAGAVRKAAIGQSAENLYFGKASGLMDQMVSSLGGFVFIDFEDPDAPAVQRLNYDFTGAGYILCITDTKGSHAGLTAEYSAVSEEMCAVARAMGAEYLRQVDEEEFYSRIPELRKTCSDRAVMRAAHFFDESRRAMLEAEALRYYDLDTFFQLVRDSGQSSSELLQNICPAGETVHQEIPLALMLSRRYLGETGACRVHGGGFAGTIQAFVPEYLASDYAEEMDRVFGEGSCRVLRIRTAGASELTLDEVEAGVWQNAAAI